MMKSIVLLNPRRKRNTRGRFVKRASARRRLSNPRRRTRRAYSKRRVTRRRVRRNPVAVVVHRRRSPARRSRRSVTVYANRRRARRNPPYTGGSVTNRIKSMFSKDNLLLAAGISVGTIGSSLVLKNYGATPPQNADGSYGFQLPGYATATTMRTVYQLNIAYGSGIPLLAGLAVAKVSPKLAQGLVLGGIANAIIGLYSLMQLPSDATNPASPAAPYTDLAAPKTSATGEYLHDYPMTNLGPGYSATNVFGGVLDSSPAFANDAWN